MPPLIIEALDNLKELAGREFPPTEWMEVTQDRIRQFAETTEDRQWIHLDAERAQKESLFGTTIAHGFLTLSLIAHFGHQTYSIQNGVRMLVNYGLNRVRFPAPVRTGTKIRGRFTLQSVEEFPGGLEAIFQVTVEEQNSEKPCCVAEWILRYYRH